MTESHSRDWVPLLLRYCAAKDVDASPTPGSPSADGDEDDDDDEEDEVVLGNNCLALQW